MTFEEEFFFLMNNFRSWKKDVVGVVRRLEDLAFDVDVNATNERGHTPLYSASSFGLNKVAERLLERYADPNVFVDNGWTPLHIASSQGRTRTVNLLGRYGAHHVAEREDQGWSPVHAASYWGHVGVIKIFLRWMNFDIGVVDNNGKTPLHHAAQQGRADAVRFLLRKGADRHLECHSGFTPLRLALAEKHLKVAELLRKSPWE